jgi:uncharacterized protein YprB with RNaseH-like and TPR domain
MNFKYEKHENDLRKALIRNYLNNYDLKGNSDAKNYNKEEIKMSQNSKNYTKSKNSSGNYYHDLKLRLLEEYQDKSLEDIKGSEVIENSYGETLKIVEKEKIDFKLKKHNFKEELLSDLKLVSRIGPATENRLKEEGYSDIQSLIVHEKHGRNAEIAIEKIENSNFKECYGLIKNSHSSNNIIKSMGLLEKENFKFMDIETLGLSNVPIILIGIAEIKGKNIVSSQYLLRDKNEEPAVLKGFFSHLDEDSAYVTYNGATFDVPFIKNRFNYYQMDYNLNLVNYDLLYYVRKLWKRKLPNCKLTTVEEHLFDIERIDDVPGAHIPGYYETYLKENNIGPLIPIIEHNRMDIVSLASFLMKIHDETCSL